MRQTEREKKENKRLILRNSFLPSHLSHCLSLNAILNNSYHPVPFMFTLVRFSGRGFRWPWI